MNAVSYLDFYIEVTGQDAPRYQIGVRSKAGEARSSTTFPYTNAELEAELQRLENAILYAQVGTRGRLPPQEAAVRDFGARFFDFLLPPGETRSLYYECRRLAEFEGKGVRLNLLIQPPHLAALPWEFLHDPRRRDYIALDPHTPLVRYPEVAQSVAPLPVAPPLRILGLVANPTDLRRLDVEAEQRQAMTALQPLLDRGLVEVTWLPGQGWRELQQWMRPDYGPWHIFHFIGHGSFDPHRDEGRIFLADDRGQAQAISATQLSRLLAFQRGTLRLAILNACEGARGGKFDALSSTAATLVLDGLPAVLAMQYAITDSAALEFARTFYSALGDNLPVDAAVAEARNAINLQNNASLEWGTPVLTMRSQDGQLFDLTQAVGSGLPLRQPATTPAVPHQESEIDPQQQPTQVVADVTPSQVVVSEIQTQPWRVDQPTVLVQKDKPEPHLPKRTGAVTPDEDWIDREAKAYPLVQPQAKKRNWWGIGLGLTGVVVVLYLSAVGIDTYQRSATALTSLRERFGLEFVPVSGGTFMLGNPPGIGYDDEQPQQPVTLDKFWIGKTEVTNRQYEYFVDDGGYTQRQWWTAAGWQWREDNKVIEPSYWRDEQWNQSEYPVVGVSWYEAVAYTRWLSATTGLTTRLPTEAEWERAARGGDGRIYPWGNEWDSSRLNYCDKNCDQAWKDKAVDDGYAYTAPVGHYPAGPYGALDLAGNVWEWTNSKDLASLYHRNDGREDPTGIARRVMRGGSWRDRQSDMRATHRIRGFPKYRYFNLGFRVVLVVIPQ